MKKLADGVLQASGSQNLAQFTSCSRLDLPTSGVLVVAHGKPGSPAANWLQAQFASRFSVGKNYLCLCFGQPLGDPGTEGEINTPLLVMSGEGMSGLAVPSDQGLEACTQYEVLASYPISRISAQDSDAADTNEFIYLRVHPLTGRMHQIRAHFASIGRPLVGDQKYSTGGEICSSKQAEQIMRMPRLFLHCQMMKMQDLEGQPFSIEMPLPENLQNILQQLTDLQRQVKLAKIRI